MSSASLLILDPNIQLNPYCSTPLERRSHEPSRNTFCTWTFIIHLRPRNPSWRLQLDVPKKKLHWGYGDRDHGWPMLYINSVHHPEEKTDMSNCHKRWHLLKLAGLPNMLVNLSNQPTHPHCHHIPKKSIAWQIRCPFVLRMHVSVCTVHTPHVKSLETIYKRLTWSHKSEFRDVILEVIHFLISAVQPRWSGGVGVILQDLCWTIAVKVSVEV